jgi:predicted porin
MNKNPFCFMNTAMAQEIDMSALFDSTEIAHVRKPVYASFKSTRIISLKSNETVKRHELDFIVSHRFGDAAGRYGGIKTFFGTDNSSDISISLDYGVTDRLTAGISRSKGATAIRQLYEMNLKYRLARQTTDNHMPISVTLYGNAVVSAMGSNTNVTVPDHFDSFSDRWSFLAQAIVVRKFGNRFTLAIIPTYVHYNRVAFGDQNDTYAIGIGGRLKLTKRMSLIADYMYVFKDPSVVNYSDSRGLNFYNPLGVGIEIETGGHVFQITFMNSTAILENQFVPYTTTSWGKGQFRWGFNMSRTFALGHHKKE